MAFKAAAAVIAGVLLLTAAAVVYAAYNYPFVVGYAPEQPVNFSHKVHAGSLDIPCQYCHAYARRSPVAGVPSVQTCWNCHDGIEASGAELDKLEQYWNNREPIPWVKVYDLPDFVHFPHMRHLDAGVACERCHGRVAAMERVERITYLNMGFCLSCHRQHNASDDCWTCHK